MAKYCSYNEERKLWEVIVPIEDDMQEESLGFYFDKKGAMAAATVWFSKELLVGGLGFSHGCYFRCVCASDSIAALRMRAAQLERIIETQQKKYEAMKSNYLQLAAEQGGEIWTAANRLVADNNKNKVEDLPKPKVDVREKAPVYVPLRGAAANVNWGSQVESGRKPWRYLDSVNGFDT